MPSVDDIISRMCTILKAKNITQLAEIIDVHQSTISTWKRRKKVPDGVISVVASLGGISFDELKYGKKPSYSVADEETQYGQELNQDLMSMIYQCFDEYEAKNGKLSPIDKARISSSIYREYIDESVTLKEVERAIRTLINFNK